MWYDLVLFIHHLEFCNFFFIFDCLTHLHVRAWPFPIGLKNTGLHWSILSCFYVPIYFYDHVHFHLAFSFFRRNRYHHLDVLKSWKAPRFTKNEKALPLYWVPSTPLPPPGPLSNIHGISGGLNRGFTVSNSSQLKWCSFNLIIFYIHVCSCGQINFQIHLKDPQRYLSKQILLIWHLTL